MTLTQWLKNGILGSSTPMPTGVGPLSALAWDDLRTPLISASGPGINPPSMAKYIDDGAGSDGVYAYDFSNLGDRDLMLSVQLPHKWKVGSAIYPHIHWANKTDQAAITLTTPALSGNGALVTVTCGAAHNLFTGATVVVAGWTGGTGVFNGTFTITRTGASTFTYVSTGNGTPSDGTVTAAPAVLWRLEYTVAGIGSFFPNTVILDAPAQIDVGFSNKHKIASFPIINSLLTTISTVLVCRVYRNPANDWDTFNADATAFELDFHYQSDSLGSDQEITKAF